MHRTILTPRNEQDWLAMRGPDLTSTDTAALFGMSPYRTAFDLFHEHYSGIKPEFKETDRMRKGKRLEASIAELAAEQEGWADLKPFKEYVRLPDERIGSSFDYEAMHNGEPIIVEIKLVDWFQWREKWTADEAPPHIEIQVAHQQLVADRHVRTAIVCWTGGYDCNVIYRDRDADMERGILSACRKFWRDVKEGNAPPVDFTKDAATIAAMFRNLRTEPVDMAATQGLDSKLLAYELAKSQASEFDKQEKALKAELHMMLGNAPEAYTNQYRIKAGWTKDTPDREAVAGEIIKGRKGYRRLDIKSLKVEE